MLQSKRVLRVSLASLSLLAGCDEMDEAAEHDSGESGEEVEPRVYGDGTYQNCSAEWIGFNEDILRYGRIATGTKAFAQCIDTSFRTGIAGGGPYRACAGEPFATSSLNDQIARAIDMSRSPNNLSISCTGGGGNASTWQNDGWGHGNAESFSWSGWFASVFDQMSFPVCAPGQSPPGCRFAAYPWPYSQAAGITWHEAAHTHGYSHGANDQAGAITACGYAGDPTWHFQVNTAPYIIGNCVSRIITDSASTCGNIDSCPGDALRIVDSFGGSSCSCVEDPAETGIVSFQLGSAFDDIAHLVTGTWYGSWNFGSAHNDVAGTGDFDGDGDEELLVRSGWGIGILERSATGNTSAAMHPVGKWIDGWNFSGAETIEAVGDFDGDGADEFVIRSGWGLGIIERSGAGFRLRWSVPFNTSLGSYVIRSGDKIIGVGRFATTGREDLLVKGATGSIVTLRLHSSVVTATAINQPGNWMGNWNHSPADTLHLPADFDGDGLDEFVIRSGWGLGIVKAQSNGTFTTIEMEPHGTLLSEMFSAAPGSGWTLSATDTLVAAGDMNTDGKAELVVRNADGVGLLSLNASNQLSTRTRFFHGSRFSGGWLFGTGDTFVGFGSYDDLGGKDLLIRSGWGIGVISLRWNNYTLLTLGLQNFASMLDGWYLKSGDTFVGNVDYDGDGIEEFLLQRK